MSQIQSHRRKAYWLFIILALFFSSLYTIIVDGFDDVFPYINTTIIGVIIGLLAAALELEIFRKIQRNFKFFQILIIRSLVYIFIVTIIIFFELAIARVFKYNLSFVEVLESKEFNNYLFNEDFLYAISYAYLLIILLNFTLQIVKKLGQGTFINFITGKYVTPVIENRIIMFINIQNTDKIIDKLGRLRFHSFLKEFIYDITESIISLKGKIYEYVDDQIVVIWDPKHGLHNSNCIRAFFEAKNRLYEQKEKYYSNFGVFPKINVALHKGNLVHGELGYVKSNIVYSGDAMNTTSRLLEACKYQEKEILVTRELTRELKLLRNYQFQKCEEFIPRGKHEKIISYTILEREPQPV